MPQSLISTRKIPSAEVYPRANLMAKWNIGPKNGMWKGGRVVDPRGYVLIRVGKKHPLADCRGYAYEHRLKAKAKKGQWIHHDNEKKGDNSDRNLIRTTRRLHRSLHRKPGSKLRRPGENNPIVKCVCGCGKKFTRFDKNGLGRPRKYIAGHNPHPSPTKDAILKLLTLGQRNRITIAKESKIGIRAIATALSKLKAAGKIYSPRRGEWRISGR
jgi:hypothetical protein